MKKRLHVSLFVLCTLSTEFSYANTIKVTSWNIEWLTSVDKPSRLSTPRTQQDIDALAAYFNQISPAVLFFQEIDSHEAIKNIVGNNYNIYLSDRATKQFKQHQFKDINQYTGIAIRENITVHDPTDIRLDKAPNSKLRFATYVILEKEQSNADSNTSSITVNSNRSIHLLSVHLKAGCSGKYRPSKSCTTLKQQGHQLNQWMKERVKNRESYIVAGDFNHNLSYPNDWFYNTITNSIDSKARLTSRETAANCIVRSNRNKEKTHQFRNLIDHIIVSPDLAVNQAIQNVYSKSDVLNYQLSDHCPVSLLIPNDSWL